MFKFTSLGAEPKQRVKMLLSDNSEVTFNFEFKSNQMGWFFTFEYANNTYGKFRLATNYNILSMFSTYLPFGLRCDTADNEEPYDINVFVNDYAQVYLLTQSDIGAINQKYYSRDEAINA